MEFLRSNTAIIKAVGPFFDKTDGVTLETALTITNERITLIAETDAGSAPTLILDNITGATSSTANDLNYITGGDNGMMQMEFAAADLNRVGRMKLTITDAANHAPVFHDYWVLPQSLFDWFSGVIVPLPANVTQLLGTAWLTPVVAGTADMNVKLIGNDANSANNLKAEYNGTGYKSYLRRFTAQAGGSSTITLDAGASSVTDFYNDLCVGIISGTGAGQGAPTIMSYDGTTKIATVSRAWKTNPSSSSVCVLLPFDLAGIIAEIVANVATAAELVTEIDDTSTKLQDISDLSNSTQARIEGIIVANDIIGATGNDTTHVHLPLLTYANDDINNMLLVIKDDSADLNYSRWIDDWDATSDLAAVATLPFTPEALVDPFWLLSIRRDVTGVSGLDAAGMRAAVGLASANLDTQIGDLPTNAELATSQAAADDATLTAIANISAITADAVWDEDATAHQTTGTFGQAIGDPVADTNTIYKAVVTDAAGATVGVDVVAVKADSAAILIDTVEIGAAGAGLTAINLPNQTMDIVGNITGNLSGSVGSVTGAVGSVTGAVGSVTGAVGSVTGAVGSVTGAVGSVTGHTAQTGDSFARIGAAGAGLTAVPWNASWDAEVESEVNDAIDTVIAELGVAAPTATPTLRTGMMLMYMALRNQLKVQTSGTDAIEVYNNAGTKIAAKAITDDGSDYVEAKMA